MIISSRWLVLTGITAFLATPLPAQTLEDGHFKKAPPTPPRVLTNPMPTERPNSRTIEAGFATLRGLDKMTGEIETFDMRVGEERPYERLLITLDACRVPPPDEPEDAFVHVVIRDRREQEPAFSGWMLASSPALSALDHPRYDVWVLSCSTSSADASDASAEN